MTPQEWSTVKDLFEQLQSVPLEDRHTRLARATAADPEVRRQVAALLDADEASNSFLETPPLTSVRLALEHRLGAHPERIGPYRVVRELGRGGMGVVYLATRDDDAYHKDVAIKIARAGFDGELLRRFHRERQMLADLDHAHIARLLDGGTTDQGYPYLVMEYIDGEPITRYCDRHRLTVSERLRLFQTICAAVHHAHETGIIHRDLKPANILIGRNGSPKLLDFGIAKLLAAGPKAEAVTLTSEMRPMTPDYASPEQIRGAAATPASDCYSLAVVLYELLSGERPYAVRGRSTIEIEQAILESAPEQPSVKAYREGAAVAAARRTTPDRLRRALQGNIDNIILMGLRKEPERRYATASDFAGDIRRHFESYPVIARPDTVAYRTAAFVRRNQRVSAVAGVAIMALCGVTVAAEWRNRRAVAERKVVESRSNEASHFGMLLLDDIYRQQNKSSVAGQQQRKRPMRPSSGGLPREPGPDEDPHAKVAWVYGYKDGGRNPAGGDGWAEAPADYPRASRVLEPLASAPQTDGRIARLLALTYERHAYTQASVDVAASLESHRQQVTASERLLGLQPDPPAQVYLATAVRSLGERLGHPYFANVGKTADARRQIERATTIAEQWVPRLPEREGTWYLGYCYSILAGIVWSEGDIDGALTLQKRAITSFKDLAREFPNRVRMQSELAMIHVRMANFLYEAGHHEDALHSVQTGIAILEPLLRDRSKNLNLRRYLVGAYNQAGDLWLHAEPERAMRRYREAEQLCADSTAQQFQDIREQIATSRSGIARALAMLGDKVRADEESRQAIEIAESLVKLDCNNAHYRFSLCLAHQHRGEAMETVKAATAIEEYRKALEVIQPMAGADPASWLKRRAVADLRERLKRLGA